MNRTEKTAEVNRIADWLGRAELAVLADYRGLTASQFTDLRKQLRAVGVTTCVVKNTLTSLASGQALKDAPADDLAKLKAVLEGPTCLFVSFDKVVEPAKALTKFAKDNEKFSIKGGWFEGGFVGKAGVEDLSSLPSREEVLAKLLSLFNAPAVQMLNLLKAPGSQVVRLLAAVQKKLEEKGS